MRNYKDLSTHFFAVHQVLIVTQLGVPFNRMAKYLSPNIGCWVATPNGTVAHCPPLPMSQTCRVLSVRFLWTYRTPGPSSGVGSGGLERPSNETVVIQMVYPWL